MLHEIYQKSAAKNKFLGVLTPFRNGIIITQVGSSLHRRRTDSRLSEEIDMKTFEIFRADINKVILKIEARDHADAFGKWASTAMISGFIKFDGGYKYIGDEKFSISPVKAKPFIAEVREIA
jgi:hypothetical protein